MTEDDIKGSLVDFTRKTEEEMYELYHKHVVALGFSITKSIKRREVGTKQIKEQYYVCSFHGDKRKPTNADTPIQITTTNQEDNSSMKRKRQRPTTRTGCRAAMRVKLDEEGYFEVKHHVLIHNHELTKPSWHHLHKYGS